MEAEMGLGGIAAQSYPWAEVNAGSESWSTLRIKDRPGLCCPNMVPMEEILQVELNQVFYPLIIQTDN